MATRQEPSLILVAYSTWAEGFEGRERGLGINGVDHLAAQDLFPVEAILQPIRNITQMWVVLCLISVEFLHSFLRHHFTGNHLGGITKCQLFSRANTNLAVSLLSHFLRSLGTRLCCRWCHTCIFSVTHNQYLQSTICHLYFANVTCIAYCTQRFKVFVATVDYLFLFFY